MNDFLEQRRTRTATSPSETDRLPPHSVEGERGVLGCCLEWPGEALPLAMERFGTDEVYYLLEHQTIWNVLLYLKSRGTGIDLISVQAELRNRGALEQIGDVGYLNVLANLVQSPANLPTYLGIVWDKFVLRRLVQTSSEQVAAIYEGVGATESFIARIDEKHQQWRSLLERGAVSPKLLRSPAEFGDEFLAQFVGERTDEPGLDLPIALPWKIRPCESTLLSGDDGSGKSTVLKYFLLHLAAEGQKICIASLEEPAVICLWVLAAQLMGVKRMPDSDAGRKRALNALAWLNSRFIIYDFLGIGDWHDILGAFRYAAQQLKFTVFCIDNVMRVGIGDDDYAQQAFAATAFANFAMENEAHLFYVLHENKADAKGKARIRGSKLWTANAANVMRVERNTEKGEKTDELKATISGETNLKKLEELNKQLAATKQTYDTRLVLQKQRYPGSRQNASRRVWFNYECFQFLNSVNDSSTCWLDHWKRVRNGE